MLLRPEQAGQKRKVSTKGVSDDSSIGSVPSFLTHLVEKCRPPEAETCSWSLSGPQYPLPTAIQQRYCYPKGDPDYSSQTGGALFTMCGHNGRENLDFRLLHVYRSAKRASNQVLKGEDDAIEQDIVRQQQQQPTKVMSAKKRPRTDPPEDLVVDGVINNTNGHMNRGDNSSAPSNRKSLDSTTSKAKKCSERLSDRQQQDERRFLPPSREKKFGDEPVAILTPRLPITSVATKWRALAIRILQCTDVADDVDGSCYHEVLDFLKYQKGHRVVYDQQGRRSNGQKRQLNDSLDALWASTSASDSRISTSNRHGVEDSDSDSTSEGTVLPKSAVKTTTMPIASKSSVVTSLLSMRTPKASMKKKLPSEREENKNQQQLRCLQDYSKPSGKSQNSNESDDGSFVF